MIRAKGFCHPVILLLAIVLAIYSCKKEKEPELILPESNQWILDSMKVYYYWNEQLPAKPEAGNSGTAFFKSLLYSADRFSYIENPDEPRTEYSSFAWYGFEYALVQTESFPGRLLGIITLVVPGGPAAKMGLKRGEIFSSVNNIEITSSTADDINKALKLGNGVQIKLVSIDENALKEGPSVLINYSRFSEKPVYMTRVFANGVKKTGYIFYNLFDGNSDYSMLDSLAKLKSEGISDIILDLRYNPGGDVSSAAKIAAVLSDTKAEQTFVIYQANKNGGHIVSSFQKTMNENSYQPQSFSALKSSQLRLDKVILLTTGATASAAELLINNLKPYANVVQIGQTTIGKDMASFAINDQRVPKQISYVLHPLIFKLYNASGQGDYSNGLAPDYTADEFSALPLKPFGDEQDPLIRKALEVTGIKTTSSSLKVSSSLIKGEPGFSSTEQRSREARPAELPIKMSYRKMENNN